MEKLGLGRVVFLVSGDVFLSWVVFFLAFTTRNSPLFSFIDFGQHYSFYLTYVVLATILLVVIFTLFYLYERQRSLVSLSYLTDYVRAVFIWGLVLVALPFFVKTDYSRFIVVFYFILSTAVLLGWRILLTYLWPLKVRHDEDSFIFSSASELVRFSQEYPDDLDLIEGLPRKRTSWVVYSFLKRVFDLVVGIITLLVILPFILIIVLIIRLDSGGPALLRQERVGRNGSFFKMYKFRTMKLGTPLYAPAPLNGEDQRFTRVGRLLRRFGVDELPQLINVLKGEMSLVGPRPEMPFIVREYQEWQRRRLQAKPGITGLWQIFGRRDVPMVENLEYDFYYLTHRSLLLDVVILLKTIPVVLFGKGTY